MVSHDDSKGQGKPEPYVRPEEETFPQESSPPGPGETSEGECVSPLSGEESWHENLEKLRSEVEQWKRKAEENWNDYLRSRADLENYKKRVSREIQQGIRMGKKGIFLELVRILDDFERALAQGAKAEKEVLVQGIEMVYRQIQKLLLSEGVKPLTCVDKPFDPAFHEAVASFVSQEVQTETVADEIQKGYIYEGEVLRPARVRVAVPAGPDGSGQDEAIQ